MNRMTKRLVSVLLALALVASLGVAAYAADTGTTAGNHNDFESFSSADEDITVGLGVERITDKPIDVNISWGALSWTYLAPGTAANAATTANGDGAWVLASAASKDLSALAAQKALEASDYTNYFKNQAVDLTIHNNNASVGVNYAITQTGTTALVFSLKTGESYDVTSAPTEETKRSVATTMLAGNTDVTYGVRPITDGSHQVSFAENATGLDGAGIKITFSPYSAG